MNELKTLPEANDRRAMARRPFGGWLHEEMQRFLDDSGQPFWNIFTAPARALVPMPALEMKEEGNGYRLTAELPGLCEADVTVELNDGILSVAGEKKEESEGKEKDYLVSERRYGAFRRQIALPGDVAPDSIEAKFKHGVLTITMAKDQKSTERKRKIEIKA